jgi:methyl-accepting chemotaxis protein
MGFISGVITGIAISAGAAAWYMSRSGQQFRDQYRVESRLGEMGDLLERRTREIQSTVNTQFAEMRATAGETATRLDDASAAAAEAAAATAAAAETARKPRKSSTAAD